MPAGIFLNLLMRRIEHVVVVVPISLCKQFANLEVTDKELLQKADIFVSNTETPSFTKAKLVFH